MALEKAPSKRKHKSSITEIDSEPVELNGNNEDEDEDFLKPITNDDGDSSDGDGDSVEGEEDTDGEDGGGELPENEANSDEDSVDDAVSEEDEEGTDENPDSEEGEESDVGDASDEESDDDELSFEELSSDENNEEPSHAEVGGSLASLMQTSNKKSAVQKKTPNTPAKSNDNDVASSSKQNAVKNKKRNPPNKEGPSKATSSSSVGPGTSTPSWRPAVEDEYKSDTSDEEDIRNTVGNIPMSWYDEYSHLGYDWDGKQITKPEKGDALDDFLRRMEDPNFWRTVKDPQTGQDVILCDADLDMIKRLQSQKIPDAQYDEYAPWIEWFSSQVMQTPVRKFPEHKRSFLPSKSEKEKVGKIVHALKMGWIKPREKKKKKDEGPQFYMLWDSDDKADVMKRITKHIPAPRRLLPGNAESYNPPPEYLFDEKEMDEWKKKSSEPSNRKLHFLPQKYNSLREVPAYSRYIIERFLRCLDLYLCPRAIKLRLTIEPEELVPKLPNPKDLQPFPTVQSLVFSGHDDMVRSITVEPKGQYLISGSDDMTIKIWEIATGRCVRTIPVGGVVRSVSWCPNSALSLVAVAADRKVLLINPGVGDHLIVSKTDALLEVAPESDSISVDRVKTAVQWEQATGENWANGIRVIVNHFKEVKQVTWHGRGDYFATVMPDGQNRSVLIHQLSKRRSQLPFTRAMGLIQCVLFHPVRPFFFVATQRNVRIYDLAKQVIVKKLLSNSKWISSMAVHPAGDNLLVGTYDCKTLWFDLDLSTQPYQSLKLHGTAVRGVAYHKRYPLFASGSDDASVIVLHGMVYNDLLQNPLIVPLKKLSFHKQYNDFGVFDTVFHPTQPWLFSCGGDSMIRLYT